MEMVAPSSGLRRIDVNTSRGTKIVNVKKNGKFDVSDPKTIKKLQEEGFTIASALGSSKGSSKLGFDCKCGFSSWFAKCSRCGKNNGEINA